VASRNLIGMAETGMRALNVEVQLCPCAIAIYRKPISASKHESQHGCHQQPEQCDSTKQVRRGPCRT
jgi:hypothetical protein